MSTSPKSVCEHSVFSRQEGWGQSSCDKLKKFEQVDPLSTPQEGRFTFSKVYVAKRGLHVQIRHKGCLLFGSLTERLQGQSSFSIVRFLCLCFGLGPAPRIFTKILKVPMSLIRRLNIRIIIYLDDIMLLRRSIKEVLIASDFLAATSRICNQP